MVKVQKTACLVAFAACCLFTISATAELPVTIHLADIDSGTTSPQGNYRWMDGADQVYDIDASDGYSYRGTYDYTQADVQVDFFTDATNLHGTLAATNLKPNFAYQVKLVGIPGTQANELIGLTGRWWQEEWNGSAWANGSNLNTKGNGSWPNPNDLTYCSRRDVLDATSPTGRKYQFTGYLVFAYFMTDDTGSATVNFTASSSYHVLWKTTQRTPVEMDGPVIWAMFDVVLPDPVLAYDTDYPGVTVGLFGEWERLPGGDIWLPPGDYEGEFVLTEESFHGGGLAGGWAAAMGRAATFTIIPNAAEANSDFDRDADVDFDDYGYLIECLAGPIASPSPTCPVTSQHCLRAFDRNIDGRIDLHDFASFTMLFR